MMQKTAILTAMILITLTNPRFCQADPRDYHQWWRDRHGEVITGELAQRAQTVFKRVLAAADKRDGSVPRLMILGDKQKDRIQAPWALCIKDDTVLLSLKALKLCYHNTDDATGDARLAFVLGHELSHLAKDDLWHLAAFEALERHGDGQTGADQARQTLMKNETLKNIREKEMRADKFGLLYAAMAGYDPTVIADTGGKNFFNEWVEQITGRIAYKAEKPRAQDKPSGHPPPTERASFVLTNLKAVKADLVLFRLGVRLFQAGRYEYALAFLNEFKQKYPCREVFNNLGLIHYQLAVEKLIECDPQRALKFKLAAMLDADTRLAGHFRGRCSPDSSKMIQFREHLDTALQFFKDAKEKDPLYFPARLNLSSAYIIKGNAPEALAAADAALNLQPDDPGALCNRAIAVFLVGKTLNTDMAPQSIRILEQITETHPDFAAGFYNLGRLHQEKARPEKAQQEWKRFKTLEHDSLFTAHLSPKKSAQPSLDHTAHSAPPPSSDTPPEIRLGEWNANIQRLLEKMRRRELIFADIRGDCYTGPHLEVLIIHDEIILMEYPLAQSLDAETVRRRYGPPRRLFKAPSGVESLVYNDFIADSENQVFKRVVCYVNNDY